MVLAGGIVGALAARIAAQSIVVGSLVGVGVLIAALSAVPNVLGLLVVTFAVGWFVTPAQAATQTILQSSVGDAVRGPGPRRLQRLDVDDVDRVDRRCRHLRQHRRDPHGLPGGRWDLPRRGRGVLAPVPRGSCSDAGEGVGPASGHGRRPHEPAHRRGLTVPAPKSVGRRRHAIASRRVQRDARARPARSSSRSTPSATPGAFGRPAAPDAARRGVAAGGHSPSHVGVRSLVSSAARCRGLASRAADRASAGRRPRVRPQGGAAPRGGSRPAGSRRPRSGRPAGSPPGRSSFGRSNRPWHGR